MGRRARSRHRLGDAREALTPTQFRLLAALAARPRAVVTTGSFRSAALRGADHYAIYLPSGCARHPERRYPVAYLLHGLPDGGGGHKGAWVNDIGQLAQRGRSGDRRRRPGRPQGRHRPGMARLGSRPGLEPH